jgi:peptidoglycan hydrolase-like protein with peptidoglycan-binding domain
MLRLYLLGAVGMAAASGALFSFAATQTGSSLNDAQAAVSGDQRPVDSIATYRAQMRLTQETLRNFGYAPGDIDGIMRSETATALRAFQREQGLKMTGQANPETLAALGIEDKLYRRPR